MKLSINWLKEFIDLSDLSIDDIVSKIYKAGFEVENIDYIGNATNLVAGEVIECCDHPDSDHLHVTKVYTGSEVLDIVCGAPNCRKGIKVIVAKVGAVLPEITISKSTIRGVESNGMLCSLKELGVREELLDEDSPSRNGIEELPDYIKVGDNDILEKLGYKDIVLDISIYANRPDCLSIFNMVREIAAILNRRCNIPTSFMGAAKEGMKTNFLVVSKTDNCPYFIAKVINNVKIKESPKWMRDYLRANGIKSINNLVDISNIVMLETGQPLHFYDYRCFDTKKIYVVDDYVGKYRALDGVEYDIEKGDLMITADGAPIGIAGIMGGDESKIKDDTTSILIESALFNNAQIRRTSNRLGLQTEAAARFSKGLEPYSQECAIDRAVELLAKYADAYGFEETVRCGKIDYKPVIIKETLSHLNGLIGKEYSTKDVENVLKRLDFKYNLVGEEFEVTVPSYRTDLTIREDLDEEIIRLSGIDDLKSTLPLMPQTIGKLSDIQIARKEIKNILVNLGLFETYSYTLVDKDYIDNEVLHSGEAIKVLSPLSDNRGYVRTSLMNSLIESLIYNLNHFNSNVNLFEISKIYTKGNEEEHLGIILNDYIYSQKLVSNSLKVDFYVLKGMLFSIFEKLGYSKERFIIEPNRSDEVHFHSGISCVLKLNNEIVGIFGKVHPSYIRDKKAKNTYYAEILLDKVLSNSPSKMKAKEISIYPPSTRDLSIVCRETINVKDIITTIKQIGGSIVKYVEVFDIFRGENIEVDKKSVSLKIVYESLKETLKSEDVNNLHEKIVNELSKKYDANIRK